MKAHRWEQGDRRSIAEIMKVKDLQVADDKFTVVCVCVERVQHTYFYEGCTQLDLESTT